MQGYSMAAAFGELLLLLFYLNKSYWLPVDAVFFLPKPDRRHPIWCIVKYPYNLFFHPIALIGFGLDISDAEVLFYGKFYNNGIGTSGGFIFLRYKWI